VLNLALMFTLASGCAMTIVSYIQKRKRTEPPRMISLSLVSPKRMEMVLCGINGAK
jgi:hypothetical protein